MKVMKFGGTSVGSPERMKGVASLVTESGEPTFIVLSAMRVQQTLSLRSLTIFTRRIQRAPTR